MSNVNIMLSNKFQFLEFQHLTPFDKLNELNLTIKIVAKSMKYRNFKHWKLFYKIILTFVGSHIK